MKAQNDTVKAKLSLSEKKRLLFEKRLKRTAKTTSATANDLPKRPLDSMPLASLGQKRIWLLDEIAGDTPSSNITSSFYIDSEINHAALEVALNKVIQRHEVLRSSYLLENGELVQYTENSLELPVERVECDSTKSIEDAAQKFVRIPFRLEHCPLLRIGLFSESEHRHILSLSIHDIVFDKWSLKIFWKEFSAFYEEAITDSPHSLPELTVQYSDFSHWQRKWLDEGEGDRQLSYWKQKLKNPPPPIPFATDHPYSNRIKDTGSLERSTLSATTSRKLRELAAKENASLFMILLLGFNILLSKYTNVSDVLVSSPVANRRKRETAELIGFFLNTVVIRTDLSANPTVLEALSQIRETSLEALTNQDLSPDSIVEAIKSKRIPGRHPLFQTMFVFQREDEGKPRLNLYNCTVSPTFIETKTSKFDLSLFVAEAPSGMDTVVEYRSDIFESSTIQRFLNHFSLLMDDLVKHPDKRVSELNFLTENDLSALLVDFQGKSIPLGETKLLPDQIAYHASASPNAIALSSPNGRNITYAELDQRVTRLAQKLIEEGAAINAPIGIYMDRSTTAIIAILATLRSGSAYLPIDPTYPEKRCISIINNAKPIAIIADRQYAEYIGRLTLTKVIDPEKFDTNGNTALPDLKPESLAYLIYTSGSTGVPKGVMVTHDNLRNSTFSRQHYYSEQPERFLLLSSFSFDSSVAGIFWTLASGKTLVIPNLGEERDLDAIRQSIQVEKVTTLLCIPGLYREIIESGIPLLSTLQTVIVAGETCHYPLVAKHYDTLPSCSLYNEYGPTETTVWCTVSKLKPNEPITIGNAIPNYRTYVLSEKQKLLPTGVPGELYVSGPGVTKGYLGDQSQTSDKFISIELPYGENKRMYRTGDRVRQLHNGTIEFLGRLDSQIKIRGFRVELGEIESALKIDPNVIESVAHAVEENIDSRVSTRLIAFLCVREKQLFNSNQFKQNLSENLAPHAIPSQFVLLDRIPHLSNGKVDRNSLPLPSRDQDLQSDFVESTNATEAILVEIWKQVLSISRISITDNFFDLGGTSLQAIRLISKIKESVNSKLSAGRLLEFPTIIELAKLLDIENNSHGESNLIKFKSGENRIPLFLVPSGGLEILFYRHLTKHIDNSIPVYGIEPIGFKENETPLESVEEMASHYVNEIRNILPNGPFHLVGHCFGATIALEMARQLQKMKIHAPIVVSLDGQAPRPIGYLEPEGPCFYEKIRQPNLFLNDLRRLTGHPLRKLKERRISKIGDIEQKTKLAIKKTGRIVRNAFVAYRAPPYDSEVLAFNCTESKRTARHTIAAWKESSPNVKMVTIDCLHADILKEPFVQQVAKQLSEKLISMHLNG